MQFSDLGIIVAIQIVIFLVLVLLLRRIMYSASAAELKRLRELNFENEKKAEQLAKELERADKEHERKIARAENELQELRSGARQDAERQRDEMLRKAREEGERIVTQALSVKEQIREEIEGEMLERTVLLACKLLADVLTNDKMKWFHERLVGEVMTAFDKITNETFRGIKAESEAVLHTPYELSTEQMAAISQQLHRCTGAEMTLNQTVEKEVIAGLTVTIGNLVIDGSLAGKLRQAAAATGQH